jgi:hypothetical protein
VSIVRGERSARKRLAEDDGGLPFQLPDHGPIIEGSRRLQGEK